MDKKDHRRVRVIKRVYLICADAYDHECPSYDKDETSLSGHCKNVAVGSGVNECKLTWSWTEEERDLVIGKRFGYGN